MKIMAVRPMSPSSFAFNDSNYDNENANAGSRSHLCSTKSRDGGHTSWWKMTIQARNGKQQNVLFHINHKLMIESRKTEVRYTTTDTRRMLNRYLVNRLCRKWTETFIDEDTNETVEVERTELILDKGTLITAENLSTIQFYINEGSVTEVEVSNQKRQSFEMKNEVFYPYLAQVQIKDKKYKILFYARSVENAVVILKDYIELNFEGMFNIIMVKEFDNCIILVDTLKSKKYDFELAYCKNEISTEEFLEELSRQVDEEEHEEKIETKWYKINSKIMSRDEEGNEQESSYTFVVKSASAERANMLINVYLKRKQKEEREKAVSRGVLFDSREITAAIEESSIIPVGCFIPMEFSEVYKE